MKLKEHGETAKHSSSKHHATAKHHPKGKRKAEKGAARQHVHTVAKTAEGAKARKLSPGWDVACCSAEALAASLRLAGGTVRPSDVLGLYWRTASHPDTGASLWDTLRAAQAYGLAGCRPRFGLAEGFGDLIGGRGAGLEAVDGPPDGLAHLQDVLIAPDARVVADDAAVLVGGERIQVERVVAEEPHVLIIGLELPGGPHAVTLDPDGTVWSWGEPWEFPDAIVEEVWAVTWS